MASKLDEVTEKAIANGGILVKLYFDMQSEKKDDLQPLMVDLVNNQLLKFPGVIYCYGSIEEPMLLEKENVYSTSAEITALFKNFASLLNAALTFTPAGIEVLKPEKEYRLPISEMQTALLNAAEASVTYAQYILSKLLSKEDYEKIQLTLKQREELGKRLLEKGKKDEAKPES